MGCISLKLVPVASAGPISRYKNCSAILAEISVNKERIKQLMASRGPTQNGAANFAGMFVPLLWFTDFQDTANTEITTLQNRGRYLLVMAEQKRCRL